MSTLEEAIEKVFESIQNDVQNNLAAAQTMTIPDSSRSISVNGSGTIAVSFHLNEQGYYHYENEKYGAGRDVTLQGIIDNPDATYSVTIGSSDGGGGHWDNLRANQSVSCKIQTSFWHSTKLTVDIQANVANVVGQATIQYSY